MDCAVDDDGKEITKGTLHHSHVNEQPFTRYVRDVVIPSDVNKVTITAKCNKGHETKAYVLIDEEEELQWSLINVHFSVDFSKSTRL